MEFVLEAAAIREAIRSGGSEAPGGDTPRN
jgi:hypothetical protein